MGGLCVFGLVRLLVPLPNNPYRKAATSQSWGQPVFTQLGLISDSVPSSGALVLGSVSVKQNDPCQHWV